MISIGGYPEIELRKGKHYHQNALRLNSARNCLEYILLARKYRKVYIPYYTCEAVIEPFKKSLYDISYEFYPINEDLEPVKTPNLKQGEAFLYTNYFGLKNSAVKNIAELYGEQLIVDNSQAFFDHPIDGIDTFYSPRKFFGVPDGGYLYTNALLKDYYEDEITQDKSFGRMTALLKRKDLSAEDGYEDFQKVEETLSYVPIRRMSKLTDALLASIDYDEVAKRRRANYIYLDSQLFHRQERRFLLRDAVPLSYPLFDKLNTDRQKLIAQRVFVPLYWPNVLEWCSENSIEYNIASHCLPLPIDQRYGIEEMNKIITVLKS